MKRFPRVELIEGITGPGWRRRFYKFRGISLMQLRLTTEDRKYLEEVAGRRVRPTKRQKAQALAPLGFGRHARERFDARWYQERGHSDVGRAIHGTRTERCRIAAFDQKAVG